VSADLTTAYLGLTLRSPLVASAGPLTGEVASAVRLVECGVGALVLPSLWEEEVLAEELWLNRSLEVGAGQFAEAVTYFPEIDELVTASQRAADHVAAVKAAVDVPVIASLNATSRGGWVHHARELVDAGADAVELNLYRVASDPTRSGADVEADDLATIAAVRAEVAVPLAVKLSPHYSSPAHLALAAVDAGADGLVLFNRFYQPDLDMDDLAVVPRLVLSSPWEMRLPLRWIAILRPHLAGRASLALTSGVASGLDVVKALAVGADVAMTTSALLRHGPEEAASLVADLERWLDEHGYDSVTQLRASMSYASVDDPAAFERAQYHRVLHSWVPPHGARAVVPPTV
jgi:dihydroorotate dehydrogenase (fumarate)